VTTLFPRSRHPERDDDTLSKIETSGARCRHQQRNQTTKPKSSAGTYAVTKNLFNHSLRRQLLNGVFVRSYPIGHDIVLLSNAIHIPGDS